MNVASTRSADEEPNPSVANTVPRVTALERSLTILAARTQDRPLGHLDQVAKRSGERLELSAEHTVVALAGATGSGKSSLFNAIVGLDLSAVGVRRPTTGLPHACVWGPEGAAELLDWLEIPPRLQTARESVLDAEAQAELRGLALLDLPDHDSTEVSHRLEVDRLVELVDMLVWVLDPQKYADAAVHSRYLRSLARHGSVVVIVLNQIDKLTAEQAEQCLADLRRLLDEDGLLGVRILATSAIRGDGLAELRELLTEAVAARDAAPRRIAADLDGISAGLQDLTGPEVREDIDRTAVKRLCSTLALAAGVPAVGEAVERTYRHQARRATQWPALHGVRWLGRAVRRARLRSEPPPPARLDLLQPAPGTVTPGGPVPGAAIPDDEARAAAPQPAHVRQRAVLHAQAETALRDLADTASRGLPDPWPSHLRHAALAELAVLPDALDSAVSGADLGVDETPIWWRVSAWLQLAALAVVVAGLGWLLLAAIGVVARPLLIGMPAPVILLVGGLVAGILTWVVSWALAAELAGRMRAHAEAQLTDAVTAVAREKVLAPVRAELRSYAELRDSLLRLA